MTVHAPIGGYLRARPDAAEPLIVIRSQGWGPLPVASCVVMEQMGDRGGHHRRV